MCWNLLLSVVCLTTSSSGIPRLRVIFQRGFPDYFVCHQTPFSICLSGTSGSSCLFMKYGMACNVFPQQSAYTQLDPQHTLTTIYRQEVQSFPLFFPSTSVLLFAPYYLSSYGANSENPCYKISRWRGLAFRNTASIFHHYSRLRCQSPGKFSILPHQA